MKVWVLILTLTNYSGTAAVAVDMASKDACVAALNEYGRICLNRESGEVIRAVKK